MTPASTTLEIRPPSDDELVPAAAFCFRSLPPADRTHEAAAAARMCRAGQAVLLTAAAGDRIVGACYAQLAGGGQAFLRPPELAAEASAGCWPQLWSRLRILLAQRQVVFVQTASGPSDDVTRLLEVGFRRVASLAFLAAETKTRRQPRTPPRVEAPVEPPGGLALQSLADVPDAEAARKRLAAVIEATYADSSDCPELDGMRSIEDVIEGYRQTGEHDPANWFFVRCDGRDVGCLLLTDHPQLQQYELIYMGLAVPYRGRGLGRWLANYAIWKCQQAGRDRILVAVDTQNQAAIRCYHGNRFRLLLEQQVLARSLAPSPAASSGAKS